MFCNEEPTMTYVQYGGGGGDGGGGGGAGAGLLACYHQELFTC